MLTAQTFGKLSSLYANHTLMSMSAELMTENVPRILESLSVFTLVAPFFTSLGTFPAFLVQNQTLMNESVRSIAYQPPPAELKAGP